MGDAHEPLRMLKQRRDFLRVARKGRSWVTPGLILQACRQPDIASGAGEPTSAATPDIGIGFTASRKVGKAVARNRAKRRLRALARDLLRYRATPGYDYVLVARGTTVTRPFETLARDLETALGRLKLDRKPGPRAGRP